MAKLSPDGKKTNYENYEEYVKIQDSRYHDYDCPNCLALNNTNIAQVREKGIIFNSLCDVGCRDAAYFDQLIKDGIVCKGIDVSPRSVEYTRSKGRDIVLGDVINLSSLFDKKFDLIISNHSLEHFLNPEKAMQECYKVLNDGGHILIKLPNEGQKIKDTKTFAHVRTYSEKELKDLILGSGFIIVHFEITKKTNEFFLIAKK